MPQKSALGAVLLAVLIITFGCRTYGKYDSEAATYREIERIVDRFERDLIRARADLAALQDAAPENPYLGVLAQQFAQVVAAHEAVLDEHRDLAVELSPGSSYRALHRAYGAMIAEQRTIRLQREGVLSFFYDSYSPDTTATGDRDRPYAIVPPYYSRVTEAQRDISVNDVLRLARTQGPAVEFEFPMPDSARALGARGAHESARLGSEESETEAADVDGEAGTDGGSDDQGDHR